MYLIDCFISQPAPVVAEQYDEIVFREPTELFMQQLMAYSSRETKPVAQLQIVSYWLLFRNSPSQLIYLFFLTEGGSRCAGDLVRRLAGPGETQLDTRPCASRSRW